MASREHSCTRRAILGAAVAMPLIPFDRGSPIGVQVAAIGTGAAPAGTNLTQPLPFPIEVEGSWAELLRQFGSIDFVKARFEEASSARAYGPGRRPFEEQEALDERFGEVARATDAAMLALLEAPAPDLEALAVKISLIADHLVWEMDGGEGLPGVARGGCPAAGGRKGRGRPRRDVGRVRLSLSTASPSGLRQVCSLLTAAAQPSRCSQAAWPRRAMIFGKRFIVRSWRASRSSSSSLGRGGWRRGSERLGMFADQVDELGFGHPAGDQLDDAVSEGRAIGDEEVPAIGVEEGFGCREGGALVALAERVIAGDAEEEGDGERRNVGFAVSPAIPRPREGAFREGRGRG